MNRAQYYAVRKLYRDRGACITVMGNPYAERLADYREPRWVYEYPGWKFLTQAQFHLFDTVCKPMPIDMGYVWLTAPACRTSKNRNLGFYRAWKLAPHLVACNQYARQLEQQH